MTNPPDPPPDRRTPFEWSLAALRPADADVARPSFMFKAGQASREKAVLFWRWVAAGLAVLLVVGAVAAFGMVAAEQQRANAIVAEVRAAHAAAQTTQAIPAPVNTSAEPIVTAPPRPIPRPAPATVAAPPAPAEVAAALGRRRNILVGGLGLIPDAPPTVSPDSPSGTPTYPNVLAAPPVDKKAPPGTESDDPPPP